MDVLCQAKSGMGKTAVFVLSVLQQLDPKQGEVSAIVLCHTRELAYQVGGGPRESIGGGHWDDRSLARPPLFSRPACTRRCPAIDTPVLSTVWRAQICHEFERFSTRLRNVKVGNFFGGIPVQQQKEGLKKEVPTIVVGTPGRVKQVRRARLNCCAFE